MGRAVNVNAVGVVVVADASPLADALDAGARGTGGRRCSGARSQPSIKATISAAASRPLQAQERRVKGGRRQ